MGFSTKDSALLSSRDAGLLEPLSGLKGKESAQGCLPKRLLGRPD